MTPCSRIYEVVLQSYEDIESAFDRIKKCFESAQRRGKTLVVVEVWEHSKKEEVYDDRHQKNGTH